MLPELVHRLRRWLLRPPPEQTRDEEAWRAWLAQRVILAMLVVSTLWMVQNLLTYTDGAPGASVVWAWVAPLANALHAAVCIWALRILERPGQRERTVVLWTAGLWVYALTQMAVNDAARGVYVLGLTLLLVASALILSHRAFIWYAALGVALVIALALLEPYAGTRIYGTELPRPYYWPAMIGGLLLAAAMLHLYNLTIHYNLLRHQRQLQERQEAEAALRDSQDRYRNFIERTFEGVWLVSFDPPVALDQPLEAQVDQIIASGVIAEANEAATRMFGYKHRSELVGASLANIFRGARIAAIRAAMTGLASAGYRGAEIEMVRRSHKTDSAIAAYFLIDVTGVIEDAPGGQALTGLWGSQRDVTQRRQMQQALQRRNEQLATLNRIGAAISTLQDLDGVLKEVLKRLNEALPLDACYVGLFEDGDPERMVFPLLYDNGRFWPWEYGSVEPGDWLYPVVSERRSLFDNRSSDEVARRTASLKVKRIGDVARISASLMAAPLQMGAHQIGLISVQSYEFNAYTPEHLEFLELAGYQVATAIENARLYEAVQRELSERQRAEAALQELNARLEQRVQERTAQMEKAMHELEAFSYSVSHDLRAPLRAIDGYSRFLLEDYAGRLDDEGLVFLNNVRKSAQRMGALIEDLLNLSRVTRSDVRLETMALSEMAEEILARLREDHPQRQVETRVQPQLTAQGDAHLLRLALQNLLDNAWKFTARIDGHPARIEVGALNKDGERVFFVRDNGAGFDMRYSNKLFKPFSRLHGIEEFEGTGIGLASVKRVIERHGGRVWAESAPGQGAVFWFTLKE